MAKKHSNRSRIYDESGHFEKHENENTLNSLRARGEVVPVYELRNGQERMIGYQRVAACSGSSPSPAAITMAEMLANVGISRFRFGDVSEGRERFAQEKTEEFGARPSYTYTGAQQGYRGFTHPGFASA